MVANAYKEASHRNMNKGDKFNRLTIVDIVRDEKNVPYAECLCDCGKIKLIRTSSILNNNTKSCGCYNSEVATVTCSTGTNSKKHGMSRSSLYRSWEAMKTRCDNPNSKHYKWYGGRGISYDPRWIDFNVFNEDMGDSWFIDATLDKINNDADYCKENCQWLTRVDNTKKGGTNGS